MYRNEYDLLKKREFYYLELDNKAINRDNNISLILGEEPSPKQYVHILNQNTFTTDLYMSRFWKARGRVRSQWVDTYLTESVKVSSMSPSGFIKMMKPHINKDIDDQTFIKNVKSYHKEIDIQNRIKELRSNYKCTDIYVIPDDFMRWEECPSCKLRPMVWEFDNGRSTACGCGEDDYNHFRVTAKSAGECYRNKWMYDSNELRNNWNECVKLSKVMTSS